MKKYLLLAIVPGIIFSAGEFCSALALPAESGPVNGSAVAADSVSQLISSAKEHIKKGEYQEARLALKKAIDLEPQNASLYALRGIVYDLLLRHPRAIKDYSRAIELDPQNTQFINLRADAYMKVNEHGAAITDYTQVISITPKLAAPYLQRAYAYELAKDGQKALADYNRAIELEPQNADTYYYRGRFYSVAFQKLGQKESLVGTLFFFLGNQAEEIKYKALNDLDKAIQLNPKSGQYFYSRGVLHSAIFDSFKGNIFRTFDTGPEKQRAINDFQEAARLFQAAGEQGNYQAAMSAIKNLR